MENEKPSYQEVENELNEYKQLLWQLSDEYKLNLGRAEKELQEQIEKYKQLEKEKGSSTTATESSFISKLGLPACILRQDGTIANYNNKFKFLIELMSFEIEDLQNISFLLKKDTSNQLAEKYENYKTGENGIFQSIFKVKNSFQGIINILVRIYHPDEMNESLALFIEINSQEISELSGNTEIPKNQEKQEPEKNDTASQEYNSLRTDILVFAEKYEVYSGLQKIISGKKAKDPEAEKLQKEINAVFALENDRAKLLEKLEIQFKSFNHEFSNKYEDLTSNEEKHCMLIKAGLTYKEIAALMDISINGVKIARNRLRKKLDLENEIKTSDFIDQF